jgi:hypothetical protein
MADVEGVREAEAGLRGCCVFLVCVSCGRHLREFGCVWHAVCGSTAAKSVVWLVVSRWASARAPRRRSGR